MKNKKLISIVSVLCLISFVIGAGFVYFVQAQTASTFWVTEGVYPHGLVTIERLGAYYFAKSSYGQILVSGTNATIVINSAVSSLSTGSIFLKDGIYADLSPITWKSNVDLIGETKDNTILRLEASIGASFLTIPANSENIRFEKFTIDGNGANQGGNNNYNLTYIINDNVNDITFENIHYTNFVGEAIGTNYGVDSYPHNEDINIFNCDFTNIQTVNTTSIIDLRSTNVAIDGNYFEGSNNQAYYSVIVRYANNSRMTNNVVNGTGAGLCFWDYGSAHTFNDVISNNIVFNLWGTADTYWGICLYGAGSIENNIVYNCSRDAIIGAGYIGQRTISGNTVTNCGSGSNGVGIWVHGSSISNPLQTNTISGNTVLECVNGIVVTYNNGSSISGNTVKDSVRYGIQLANVYHSVVDGNVVTGCDSGDLSTYSGIYIAGSYNVITDNRAYDNDLYDIWVSTDGSTNLNNTVTGCSTVFSNSVVGIKDDATDTEIHSSFNHTMWIT